jgi:hypothetical protein
MPTPRELQAILTLRSFLMPFVVAGFAFGVLASFVYVFQTLHGGSWDGQRMMLAAVSPVVNPIFTMVLGLVGYPLYRWLARREILRLGRLIVEEEVRGHTLSP